MCIPCASPPANCGVHKQTAAIPSTWTCGKTILNQPKSIAQADTLAVPPRLPRDDDGPVFAEPWQAQAFALAVKLSELGHFTWIEWAEVLAQELKADSAR